MSPVTMVILTDLESDMIHFISFSGSYVIQAVSSSKKTKIKYNMGE